MTPISQPIDDGPRLTLEQRRARLHWNATRYTTWERLAAEQAPPYRWLLSGAGATFDPYRAVYGDIGQWAALAFQATGDPRFARYAVKRNATFWGWGFSLSRPGVQYPGAEPDDMVYWGQTYTLPGGEPTVHPLVASGGGDFVRENGMTQIAIADWIRPAVGVPGGITQSEWDRLDGFNRALVEAAVDGTGVLYMATGDHDGLIGIWGMVALFELWHHGNDENEWEFLKRTSHDNHGAPIPLGGLHASGLNTATFRNGLAKVGGYFESGTDPAGTHYGPGDIKLYLRLVDGLRTLTGDGSLFPEADALLPAFVHAGLQLRSPGGARQYAWNDTQGDETGFGPNFHTPGLWWAMAGLTEGTREGAWANAVAHQLWERSFDFAERPALDPMTLPLWPYYAEQVDPWTDRALPDTWRGRNRSLLVHRSGRDKESLGVVLHAPEFVPLDHWVRYTSNLHLFAGDEHLLRTPLAYGIQGYGGAQMGNGLLCHGLGMMFEAQGEVAWHADARHVSQAAATGGQLYLPWQPNPGTWLHEATTTQVALLNRDSAAVILCCRVHADHPLARDPDDALRYQTSDIAWMLANKPREYLLHALSEPEVLGPVATWQAAGRELRLEALLPDDAALRTIDERADPTVTTGHVTPETLAWQVRAYPQGDRPFDVFLLALTTGEVWVDLLRDPTGQVVGTNTRRPGENDAVDLFNAEPDAPLPQPRRENGLVVWDPATRQRVRDSHLRWTGYTVPFVASTPGVDAYLHDLHPAQQWRAEVGSASYPLTVEPGGVAHLRLDVGAGAHELRVTAQVTTPEPGPLPPPTTDPELPPEEPMESLYLELAISPAVVRQGETVALEMRVLLDDGSPVPGARVALAVTSTSGAVAPVEYLADDAGQARHEAPLTADAVAWTGYGPVGVTVTASAPGYLPAVAAGRFEVAEGEAPPPPAPDPIQQQLAQVTVTAQVAKETAQAAHAVAEQVAERLDRLNAGLRGLLEG